MRWASQKVLLRRVRGRLMPLLQPFSALSYKLRNRNRSPRDVWTRGIGHELDFWRRFFAEWEDEVQLRLDPDRFAPEDAAFWELVEQLPQSDLAILDVGAGPLTLMAKRIPGKGLTVTAVDPLATEYEQILKEAGINPPVRTIQGSGEELLDQFAPRSFDVAYARNSLDHAYDPPAVIRNMIEVTRPAGLVFLDHFLNEGQQGLYRGLHQWNFNVEDGDFVVWSPDGRRNVTRELAGVAEITCRTSANRLLCVIRPIPAHQDRQ